MLGEHRNQPSKLKDWNRTKQNRPAIGNLCYCRTQQTISVLRYMTLPWNLLNPQHISKEIHHSWKIYRCKLLALILIEIIETASAVEPVAWLMFFASAVDKLQSLEQKSTKNSDCRNLNEECPCVPFHLSMTSNCLFDPSGSFGICVLPDHARKHVMFSRCTIPSEFYVYM